MNNSYYNYNNLTQNLSKRLTNFVDDILTKDLNDKFFTSIFDSSIKVNYPFDVYTLEDDLYIEIPAIGLDKKDITIETENNNIRIFYKKVECKKDNREYIFKKITNKEFDKSFYISEKFDLEKIEANLDKGSLIVKIPSKKEEKVTKKNIIIN